MRIVSNLLQHAPIGVLLALLAGFAFPDPEPANLHMRSPRS